MGKKIKLPKTPKIKMDPGKLVSKAVEGAVNVQKDIMIKPATELAKAAVGGVGEVMSQPGAGAVLGAGLTAMGIPGAGLLAGAFSPSGAPVPPPSGGEVQAPPVVLSTPPGAQGNNQMIYIAGGAGLLVILLTVILMNRKK